MACTDVRRGAIVAAVALGALALATGCKRRKPEAFTKIWLGPNEACGRLKSTDVVCWGNGQPAHVAPELGTVLDVALGDGFRCVHRGDQITCDGLSTGDPVTNPLRVFAGSGHACATRLEDVRCWGKNDHGQAAGWKEHAGAIALGEAHTCVAIDGDAVHCWGRGYGDGKKKILAGVAVHELAAGRDHTCALVAGGTVRCWTPTTEPVAVEGLAGAAKIVAGDAHACALLTNGSVACWGDNRFSQLADGTTEPRARATPVQGLFGVAEIVAAGGGTCVRLGDGEVKCWGNDDHGQLAWPALPPGVVNVPTSIRYVRPAR